MNALVSVRGKNKVAQNDKEKNYLGFCIPKIWLKCFAAQSYFIKHKPLISEEWPMMIVLLFRMRLESDSTLQMFSHYSIMILVV